MFIANDFDQFKNLFIAQLRAMLSAEGLGAFILVLANSQQDEFLKAELRDDLEKAFINLKKNFSSIRMETAPDDVAVFEKLLDINLDDIHVWQNKTIGHWQVSYNSLRQLRPARASSQVFSSIKQEFDEAGFHFNKPFLSPEILWQGEYQQVQLRVLYNKFPFSDYHLLIAVSPERNSPQQLTQETHRLSCFLASNNAKIFPGFGIGFNSMAAGASVNHLHLQGFVHDELFPIESGKWKHNGGEAEYPLMVKRFTDAEESWFYINSLTGDDRAFNCLYRQNCCYVIPRVYQGAVELPEWLAGAGWLDVAGVMTVSDEDSFASLDEQSVTQALRLLSIY